MAAGPTTALILSAARGPRIGGVQISASISETHRRSAEITAHAVELGSDVNDHRRVKQLELRMDGVVSGAPITAAEVAAYQTNGDDTQDRYDDLCKLFADNQPFDVVTGLAVYNNMEFETFEVQRDAKTGKAIHFTATLKQMIFVNSERAARPPSARSKTELGAKPTTASTEKTGRAIRQSTLNKLLGGIDGARELRELGQ